VPVIGPDDKVILWGGGIYNWFDPLTLIHAVDRLRGDHPEIRLFFMGLKHPNPGVPDMRIAWETRQLSERLGLTGTHVFFNEGWVPYAERADYLLDADVGVSTHFLHIETAYSFRTRILDYLWASLPIVATDGDTFGTLIREHDLGRVVPPEDVEALTEALREMLVETGARAAVRGNIEAFAREYRWSRTLAPLVEFCRHPRRAPDLAIERASRPTTAKTGSRRPRGSLRSDLALVRRYLKAGGVREVGRRIGGRLERVARRGRDGS
jgi:glycosyltransferase involved in cell wall biosynthesis